MSRAVDIHMALLEALPELGEDFGAELVLGNFGQFAWESHVGGQADVARRACAAVEWLLEERPDDYGPRVAWSLLRERDWGAGERWFGPRTVAARDELASRGSPPWG